MNVKMSERCTKDRLLQIHHHLFSLFLSNLNVRARGFFFFFFFLPGGEKKSQIEWDTGNNKEVAQTSRVFSGEMTVVESGCSVKPKIFSHFIKERHTRTNGDLVTLHYAFFKVKMYTLSMCIAWIYIPTGFNVLMGTLFQAFRFPTSNKVVLQCHVQVCYKTCPDPPPCR